VKVVIFKPMENKTIDPNTLPIQMMIEEIENSYRGGGGDEEDLPAPSIMMILAPLKIEVQ